MRTSGGTNFRIWYNKLAGSRDGLSHQKFEFFNLNLQSTMNQQVEACVSKTVINPRRMREGYGSRFVCVCVCVCVCLLPS